MNKSLLWLLIAFIFLSISFILRINKQPIFLGFKHKSIHNNNIERKDFYLYYFFSLANCKPCLESLHILKKYSNIFEVIGVIPDSEMKDIDFIKREFGVDNIVSEAFYLKYKPIYSPSVIGVDNNGTVYFVLPIVSGYSEYMEAFLILFLTHLTFSIK